MISEDRLWRCPRFGEGKVCIRNLILAVVITFRGNLLSFLVVKHEYALRSKIPIHVYMHIWKIRIIGMILLLLIVILNSHVYIHTKIIHYIYIHNLYHRFWIALDHLMLLGTIVSHFIINMTINYNINIINAIFQIINYTWNFSQLLILFKGPDIIYIYIYFQKLFNL